MAQKTVLNYAAIAIPLASAAVAAGFYVATFFGYGWPTGKVPLAVAWGALYLSWAPRLMKDRAFFLQHWGIGMYAVSRQFRWQPFPARREQWLNPFARALFALLIVHFIISFAIGSRGGSHAQYAAAMLRLLSLMVVIGGVCTALQWIYPPTLTPENLQ